MKSRALRLEDLVSLLPHPTEPAQEESIWGLSQLAGRLVEISGEGDSAALTAVFGVVLEAQACGEPVAWITLPYSSFFPPDAAEGGVDIDALAVVRAPNEAAAVRSALQLVRSGAFGLIVLDFGPNLPRSQQAIAPPLQTRMAGLAQKHDTAIVVLTEKPPSAPSLGSLVSLRAEAHRVEVQSPPGDGHPVPLRCEVRITTLKDKRRGPGRLHQEACHGPDGLC